MAISFMLSVKQLGTLRTDDGDSNDNVLKAIGLIACVQTSPISFVARGNRRRLHAGNRFNKQNNNFAVASHFFAHFFVVCARLRRENA